MASVNLEGVNPSSSGDIRPHESAVSAVSWPAILAGTFVAISLTFVLMELGTGLGLASVSPWANKGVSATTFTMAAVIWLIVVQWGASAVGGYTTGRLRTKWAGLHTHEVFFRDTAHGLITWATATAIVALMSAGAALHAANHGMQAAATLASGAMEHAEHGAPGPGGEGPGSYEVDSLLRSPGGEPLAPQRYAEVGRVMKKAVSSGTLSQEDRTYLASLVAAHSSIPPAEAQKRVDEAFAKLQEAELQARKAADTARKAAAEMALYMALSMLIGAFVASASAALGGKLRDEHH